MKAKLWILLAVVLVLALGWMALQGGWTGGKNLEQQPRDSAASAPERVGERPGSNEDLDVDRVPGVLKIQPPPSPAVAGEEADPRALFRGRVIDVEGASVPGVLVKLLPGRSGASTEALVQVRANEVGEYELPVPSTEMRVEVEGDDLVTVLASVVGPTVRRAQAPVVVVVGRAVALDVLVTDEEGRALGGAQVAFALPRGFRNRFDEVLDHVAYEPPWTRTVDGQGRLDGWTIARVPDAVVVGTHAGYLPSSQPAPLDASFVHLHLRQAGLAEGAVRGIVTDEREVPLPGAFVGMGLAETATSETGEFVLALEEAGKVRRLVALMAGYQSVEKALGPEDLETFQHLRLGPPPRALKGRVVDPGGHPVAGAKVWPKDLTVFASQPFAVETFLAGGERMAFEPATTDAQGRFEVRGLLDREYSLVCLDSRTQTRVEAGPFPAGEEVGDIRLPLDAVIARVAGVVVAPDGAPLAGVRVQATSVTFKLEREEVGVSTGNDPDAPEVRTDAEGRFAFRDLASSEVFLRVSGEDVVPAFLNLEEDGVRLGDLEDLRIEVSRRIHLQVELVDPARADTFSILDERGEEIWINIFYGGMRNLDTRPSLQDGRSPVCVVPESARTLILYKGENEVHRQPVLLRTGEVNTIRL